MGIARTSPKTFLEGSNPNFDSQYRYSSPRLTRLLFTTFDLTSERNAFSASSTSTPRFSAIYSAETVCLTELRNNLIRSGSDFAGAEGRGVGFTIFSFFSCFSWYLAKNCFDSGDKDAGMSFSSNVRCSVTSHRT